MYASETSPDIKNISKDINYWRQCYYRHKQNALCLDIEVTRFNGPIALVGIFPPIDGYPNDHYQSFIKDKNLTKLNLIKAFEGKTMLITFNGISWDVKKIRQEFGNVIPKNILLFDLYLFAKSLGLGASLRTLEFTFGIERLHDPTKRKGIAIALWKKYQKTHHEASLRELIEYNKQDTINVYILAESLMEYTNQRGVRYILNQQL